MKSKLIVLSLLAVLWAGLIMPSFAGRASAAVPTAPTAGALHSHAALFDKTRFLLHMGLAYLAFHHWVWKPYKAHGFDKGADHRVLHIAKAAVALLFTYHELKKAYDIAKKSHSGFLHALIAPLNGLIGKANSVWSGLNNGKVSDAALQDLNGAADNLGKLAGGIKDVQVAIPGT